MVDHTSLVFSHHLVLYDHYCTHLQNIFLRQERITFYNKGTETGKLSTLCEQQSLLAYFPGNS